jgi:hypothetical protein
LLKGTGSLTTWTTGCGDRCRRDTGDEATDRRAETARDDPEAVDADVQNAWPSARTDAMSPHADDHRDAAAALDRLAGGQPRDPAAGLTLAGAGDRWTVDAVGRVSAGGRAV